MVISKLRSIVETEEDAGHVIRAARILVSEDLAAAIRHMEHQDNAEATRRTKIETAVGLVLEHHPEVPRDLAERYVRECLDRMEPTNLTDTLRDRLGLWQSEPLTDETLAGLWHELGLPGEPDGTPQMPQDEPQPPPAVSPVPEPDRPAAPEPGPLPCGLVELPRRTPVMSPEEEERADAETRQQCEAELAFRRNAVTFGDISFLPDGV